MKSFVRLAYGLAILQTLVAGSDVPNYFRSSLITPRDLSSVKVQYELGSRLSNTTTILGPRSSNFNESTTRWDSYAPPKVQVVIEPGQESDIPLIVQYCNSNSIEFLVYNTGHGSSKTLGSFDGIQISMGSLRETTIRPDGKTAWFQGGAIAETLIGYLWDQGYVTPTGATDCVGVLGAGLGGGHGRLEGHYGMMSDNIVQLNVVLANGTAIHVNETSHSDLLWGMKGAGHNFGIVTSAEVNIYARGPDTWYYKAYYWRGDKLDAIFTALNQLEGNGTTPVNMAVNYGSFLMDTNITTEEPVIFWNFAYRGPADEASSFLAPFDAIEAVSADASEKPYPQLSSDPSLCEGDVVRIITTAGLQVYNLTTERQIWESFTKRVAENPNLASGAIIIHEGYSSEAVQKLDPASSAYPFRSDHNLMQFQGNLEDTSLEDEMWEWAWEVRDLWNAGQPGRLPNAYVNYANGFESVEQWYGHESWRIEKLRDLKIKYDPNNRFRFYNPIV